MPSSIARRVAVVTDSTSDLPRALADELGLFVVPQILIMGGNEWLDGIDIDPPAFYELLRTSSDFPSTSQPSAAYFQDVFTQNAEGVEGIVAVLISNELSGTINSALTAAQSLPDLDIEVIDSRAASMQLGLIALAAARAAAAGANLQEVAEAARALVGRTYVYFVVDTLEYLHRGGRIGAAAKLFGSALNLKPILEINDGIVTPVTRVRSRRRALETVYNLVTEKIPDGAKVHMAVLHVAAPDEAAAFAAHLEQQFHPVQMITSEAGPVVGAHVGPGALGVAFYVE